MRVLLTGGAGYIGSHTAKVLSRAGHEPVVLDNLSTGHVSNVKWGPLIQGDIGDRDLVRSIVRQHGIEACIHFAAKAYVGESVANPRLYFHNNVVCSLNLLDALVDAGVGHLVFSSTCATYGMPITETIAEEHPQQPINPYGETKLMIEKALHWISRAHPISYVALRYFNACGADPEGELGEDHDPETHLIPLCIYATLGILPRLDVFGSDYPTPDGTAIRDYTHVTDLAEAHVAALAYLLRGGPSTAVNLGSGAGSSIRQVLAAVEAASGKPVPTRDVPRREGDPPVLVANNARAMNLLGWRCRYSALDDVIRTSWNWHSRVHAPTLL